MQVELLFYTPLWVAAKAIRKCWASEGKSDTIVSAGMSFQYHPDMVMRFRCEAGEKDRELIYRVGNKNKHSSTLEHLNYTFDIDGVSRALLQELARHRHTSLSVKSTRYTLKELKGEEPFNTSLGSGKVGVFAQETYNRVEKYIVSTGVQFIDDKSIHALEGLRQGVAAGISNDRAKYCLPDAYRTSLVWTINARSLQNFLNLRTNKAALWEIRDLANEIFNQLPDEHKYLFEEFVHGEQAS